MPDVKASAAEQLASAMPLELPARLLIVEDDSSLRALLKKTFAKESEVLQAANGQEALAMISKERPEFVITDLMMPVLDGLQLIIRARRTPLGACLPFLVLTAKTEEQVLIDCFRHGADDFMLKPFSIAELRVRVSSIYLRHRIARDMNPLTRLPGNQVLKQEIERRVANSTEVAVAYVDLNHFKEFNDAQGFDRGDHVLGLLADLLTDYTQRQPLGEVFVGHLGGDDFVVVLPMRLVQQMADNLFREVDLATGGLYKDHELAQGFFRAHNRRGVEVDVPLLSIAIGVVSTQRRGMNDLRYISQVAAEVKHMAKQAGGNHLFIDRRIECP